MNSRYFFFPLLLSMAILLAACQPVAPQPASPPAPAPSQTPVLPRLTLKPCTVAGGAIQAECGYLQVPEDRSSPNGRILELYTVVVRARGASPAPDPLFFLAGGPGDAATTRVISAYNIFRQVNELRDVVFVDQRGTNDLHRLTCTPPGFSLADAAQPEVDAYTRGCLASLKADPRFYTTAAYARDLEDARAVLGYDRINLYGISYGVSAAQVYLRLYESRVRSAVLDHGSFLDLPMFNALAHSSQMALERVFSRCQKDPACQAAYPDLPADWQAVLSRIDQGVSVDASAQGTPQKVKITRLELAAVHSLLVDAAQAVQIPQLIHSLAAAQDWSPIVNALSGSSSSASGDLNLIFYTTVCNEGWAGYAEAEIARLGAGSYLLDYWLQNGRATTRMCASLPKADPSVLYGSGRSAATPVLILSGEADPQNPPENMAQAAAFWPNSRQIIEPGEGHSTPSVSCRWDIVAQFIAQASAWPLDPACLSAAASRPFH